MEKGIKIISFFIGMIVSIQAIGQNTIVYSYDSAGNRILRDATANSNPGFSNDSLPKFVLPFDYFYTPAYRANDAFSGPLVSAYK